MQTIEQALNKLETSKFRSSFALSEADIKYIDNSQEESATDKEEASEQDSPAADTSEEIAKTSDATGIMGYIGMLLVSLGIFAVALNRRKQEL